jgi:acetyl esterase/lipase
MLHSALLFWTMLAIASTATAEVNYTRQMNVIYGRSFGTSLTMDVISPKENPKGLGVIWVVSGGWYSAPEAITPQSIAMSTGELTRRGYTVFAVCHGSAPRFTIQEAVNDMNRSVRFIRSRAAEYKIDPKRLGVFGGSAGGHLTMMLATAPLPPNQKSSDPVDKLPSNVQAAAAFFPPTDFLNYGKEGRIAWEVPELAPFRASFDFEKLDEKTKMYERLPREAKIEISKRVSPLYHVTADDAPALLIHGDADTLVPIQQAHVIVHKYEAEKVPVKLVTKPGAGHGWAKMDQDVKLIADWFDEHLEAKPTTQPASQPTAAAGEQR